jgi:hypothetical protein
MYSDTPSCLIRCALGRVRTLALGLACVLPTAAGATPPGWSTAVPVTIIEESGVDLADYQVRLVVDTASLIGAGEMKPDASDLRFATDFEGSNPIGYWIEGGVGTASTVVWIKGRRCPRRAPPAYGCSAAIRVRDGFDLGGAGCPTH